MSSHQEYVDSMKHGAVEMGKHALITYLKSKALTSWLIFTPILGPIVSLLIGKIVSILVTKTEFAIFFKYIDMRVDAQGRAFSEAAVANYKAQVSGTPEEKKKAELNLMDKFKKFVVLGS